MSEHWIAWIFAIPLALAALAITTLFSKGLSAKVDRIGSLPKNSKIKEFKKLVIMMRIQLIACLFGIVPGILLSKWLLQKLHVSDQFDGVVQIFILIAWFVSLFVLEARAGFLICPSCAKNFFLGEGRGRRGLPFLLSCRECGYRPGSDLG